MNRILDRIDKEENRHKEKITELSLKGEDISTLKLNIEYLRRFRKMVIECMEEKQ